MHISFAVSAFIAGIITFFAPCTLPLVPGYLAFISGVSLQEIDSDSTKKRRKIFFHGVCFVVGFSFIFILFGALAGFVGSSLWPLRIGLARIGGIFIIGFGLFMLNIVKIPFLNRDLHIRLSHFFPKGTFFSSFFLGGTFALGWTPCVGPILGTILLLASTSVSVISGILLLALFSAGLALPFLLLAFTIDSASRFIARMRGILAVISFIGGIFLIMIGIVFLLNTRVSFFGYNFFDLLSLPVLMNYL